MSYEQPQLPVVTLGSDVAYAFFYKTSRDLLSALKGETEGLNRVDLASRLGHTKHLTDALKHILLTQSEKGLIFIDNDITRLTPTGDFLSKNMLPIKYATPFMSDYSRVAQSYILSLMAIYAGYSSIATLEIILGKKRNLIISPIKYNLGNGFVDSNWKDLTLSQGGKDAIKPVYHHIQKIEDILHHDERQRTIKHIRTGLFRLSSKDPVAARLLGIEPAPIEKEKPLDKEDGPKKEELGGMDAELLNDQQLLELAETIGDWSNC